jgi:hypothetical protein
MTVTDKKNDKPIDNSRQHQDRDNLSQSDKPWEKNPQNTTDPSLPDTPKPDLENWGVSKTH